MSILKNLTAIKERTGPGVKLVAVTKGRSVREINQAVFLGVTDIGENRVSEAMEKKPHIKGDVKWHMIGHLQSNKANDAVDTFDLIQGVDSVKLAKKIDSVCSSKNKVMSILVQVNISNDPQKFGVIGDDLVPLLVEISKLKHVKVLGLMTIILQVSEEEAEIYFKKLKNLFEKIKIINIPNIEMKYLSMGMSDDYVAAINVGSNMVRIGRAIFENESKKTSGTS